jgi:predicted anti-sigma-YlaC factor YlaD
MKASCEIIKDLLPLYFDGVCSNESRRVVDEHLTECTDCKTELKSMGEAIQINEVGQNLSEADAIKRLSVKWRKGKLKSFLKGALIAILVIAAVVLFFSLFFEVQIVYSD